MGSASRFSSRINAIIRPRHSRETKYRNRVQQGDAYVASTEKCLRDNYGPISQDTRYKIQQRLNKLRSDRSTLLEFNQYGRSRQAEKAALSRAATFRVDAEDIYRIAECSVGALMKSQAGHYTSQMTQRTSSASRCTTPMSNHASPVDRRISSASRNTSPAGWCASQASQRVSGTSVRAYSSRSQHPTPHNSRTGSRAHSPAVSQHHEEPLEIVQIRAGPVSWSQHPSTNALHLDLGLGSSPRPPPFISRDSLPSLDMSIAQLGPTRKSTTSTFSPDVDVYSIASDGFPRPSRRAAQRGSTIQTRTSLSKSSVSHESSHRSRRGTQSSWMGGPSYESPAVQSRRVSQPPSTRSRHRAGSQDSHYAHASARTSSVPPSSRTIYPGTSWGPPQYY